MPPAENNDTSLRDALSAAMDGGIPDGSPDVPEPAPVEPEGAPAESSSGPARDSGGRFRPKAQKESAQEPAKPNGVDSPEPTAAREAASPDAPQPAATGEVAPVLRAPQSWKPALREKWAGIDPDVRSEIVRRERETATALQERAEATKEYARYQDTVRPYEAFIRGAGSEPLETVQKMLQTAVMLRTAPAQTKARGVASLIREHGIDIQMLNAELFGPDGQAAPVTQGQQFQDPRVDELLAKLNQAEENRTGSLMREASSRLESFSETHEFFEDVRMDMADLMELAAKRGVALTEEQAYARACAADPDISKILEQRRAAQTATTSQEATQRAKIAASSVRSSPSASSESGDRYSDRRAAIEASMEEIAGR
jgi:hypothetical protein